MLHEVNNVLLADERRKNPWDTVYENNSRWASAETSNTQRPVKMDHDWTENSAVFSSDSSASEQSLQMSEYQSRTLTHIRTANKQTRARTRTHSLMHGTRHNKKSYMAFWSSALTWLNQLVSLAIIIIHIIINMTIIKHYKKYKQNICIPLMNFIYKRKCNPNNNTNNNNPLYLMNKQKRSSNTKNEIIKLYKKNTNLFINK